MSLSTVSDAFTAGAVPRVEPLLSGVEPGVRQPQALSGWEGANDSSRRGYVYFPTLETRRELDTYSRLEQIRRARWLTRNSGFAKRCKNGVANMVGYLSPRALTKDKEWNLLAEKAFEARAGSAMSFDRQRRFNVYSYQPLITRSRLGDGDFFTVLTESLSGGAQVMSYEAHQVGNGSTNPDERGWRDGIQTDALGASFNFRFLDGFKADKWVDVPAENVVHHADFDSCGWRRPPTAFHCAINHMLDSTELQSDVKLGVKISNRIGYYLSSAAGQAAGGPPKMGDNFRKATGPNGDPIVVDDSFFRGGKIPNLAPGQEIKQLLDQRPHPNTLEFLEFLNRDIAWGMGISADILWNIAKLGGASVRYVLADAQVFLEAQQQILVDQFLTRFWVYFIAKEMKAGRLRRCEDPEWWVCGWQPPAKLTVDIGRDGKLSIDLHRAGMLTMKRWYGMQGLDDEVEDRQRVEEYVRRIMLCKEYEEKYPGIVIDPEKVFPSGMVVQQVGGDTDPEPGFEEPENVEKVEVAA